MAATPMASLATCSWCGLLAERGPICDACGSPVAETTGRTTVLRVPEASRDSFRQALRASRDVSTPAPTSPATPTSVHPRPAPSQGPSAEVPESPTRRAARWLNMNQASVMSGVPERTLRGWAHSKTPEDVPIREGDPRFLLIRTPGLKPPDGLWMVDGPGPSAAPASSPGTVTDMAPPYVAAPVAPVAAVAPVPRPDLPTTVAPVAPVARDTTPPPPPRPQPPVRAPIVSAAVRPAAPVEEPAAPAPRGPVLSDLYLEALLAEDSLPETWGFDSSPDERKLFRRHKVLTTAGLVLGFAGIAELIDFLMSHLH